MFQSASMPKSVKLKLKGGGYVDPDSGLQDKVGYTLGCTLQKFSKIAIALIAILENFRESILIAKYVEERLDKK